ncbi:hypothetical protein jhhlp_004797 [Lomentospora prolificans]|uniref:Secreted protein n=1 Tax=Lomentospora prolificans TaxID=41688 RepID=A0A2N3N8K8_9PEZI|nr:hypothetical protein jhhlp_004797 [Lomentospora prolificans]
MKLWALAALSPLVSAVCDTAGGQLSLTFGRLVGREIDSHEVCPAGGSCVNMQTGPDDWAQKLDAITMEGKGCLTRTVPTRKRVRDCPEGVEIWQPPCPDNRWAEAVPEDWKHGAMKSYTVWHR